MSNDEQTPFMDMVEWAMTHGTFINPAKMFELIADVRAGTVTLTQREHDMLATMTGVMQVTAPAFLKELIGAVAEAAGPPAVGVNELLTIKAFVMTVNAVAEEDIAKGNPITGAHHRAIERVVESIEMGVTATATPQGKPS